MLAPQIEAKLQKQMEHTLAKFERKVDTEMRSIHAALEKLVHKIDDRPLRVSNVQS